MPDVLSGRSETDSTAAPSAKPLRRFIGRLIFLVCFLSACSLLAIEVSEPMGKPEACISCHEMKGVHDRWAKSTHHVNPSGVRVTCLDCHLAPREDHFAHLYGKVRKGAAHTWVHFFGQYDETASRRCVLDTLPNERCTICHDNLGAMPSTPAVGAVHATALKRTDNRIHACVACHDHLHSFVKPPEKKSYDTADNSFCFDCHVNFKKEPFVVQHQAANVGCVACHGESLPHADDEEHTAAPSIMYTKDQVNKSCQSCHKEPDLKKTTSHKPWYAGADPDKKYCTHCHGMHRLDERQRKWDKKTKKLIWSGGHNIDPNEVPTTKPFEEESM